MSLFSDWAVWLEKMRRSHNIIVYMQAALACMQVYGLPIAVHLSPLNSQSQHQQITFYVPVNLCVHITWTVTGVFAHQ